MIRMLLARLAAVAAMLLLAGPATAAQDDRPPNIIYILADDLGYGELGCYGQKWIRTPHLDQLARQGMRFTQHYAGNAVCAPSRCCLMTGKHPGHAFIRNNRAMKRSKTGPKWPGQLPIPDEAVTIAEMLKQRGYATAAIGKWGLGHTGNSGDPLGQGFDLFYGFQCQTHAHNHYPRFLWHNGVKETQPGNDRTATGETYCQDQFTRMALQFIRENRDRPFFLYLPLIIPHLAIQVPEASLDQYRGKIPEADYKHRSRYERHPTPRAGYAAMIGHMDRDVGRIMALLKKLGLDDNTLVIFSSDNGPTYKRLGGADSAFFNSTGPLRGRKGSLYEGGIRVPMIARWPGRIKPGSTTNHVSAFWDVLPTLAELMGTRPPKNIDGVSFAPTLLGQTDRQAQHPWLYWEFQGYGGQQAVRMGRWKAIRRDILPKKESDKKKAKQKKKSKKKPASKRSGPPPLELYDLEADPGEKHNVAQKHPDVVRRIKEIMKAEHTPSKSFPMKPLDKPRPARTPKKKSTPAASAAG